MFHTFLSHFSIYLFPSPLLQNKFEYSSTSPPVHIYKNELDRLEWHPIFEPLTAVAPALYRVN